MVNNYLVVAKSSKMHGIIKKKFFGKLDEETVPPFFKSLICPILEYFDCVWALGTNVQRVSICCGEGVMKGYKAIVGLWLGTYPPFIY